MGRKEAIEDGIEFWFDHRYYYKVPCDVCGTKVIRGNYGRRLPCICDSCKAKKQQHKKEIEKAWFDVIEEKGEHRYNKALDAIQKQVKDFSKYETAARIARKAQDKYGSVPEAMVAVELIKLGYRFIPQQKIKKYRVDFFIPDIPMIIEVDGEIYHSKQTNREAEIQFAVGFGVKILHVPAELIANDIQKLGALIDKRIKMP